MRDNALVKFKDVEEMLGKEPPTGAANLFLREVSRLEASERVRDHRQLLRMLRNFYRRLYRRVAPTKTGVKALKYAVGYMLQERGYTSLGRGSELSEKFKRRARRATRLRFPFQRGEALRTFRSSYFQDSSFKGRDQAMKKTTKKTASKNASKISRPPGNPGRIGKTTGLNVKQFLRKMLEENEAAARKRGKKPRTDEELVKLLKEEFGEPYPAYFESIQSIRTNYNKGGLGGEPDVTSKRYDSDGKEIEARTRRSPGSTIKKTTAKKTTAKKRRSTRRLAR